MVNEQALVTRATKKIVARFPGVYHWKITDMKAIGKPDSVFILDGSVVFIEFKRLGPDETIHTRGKVKELQWMELLRLDRAGVCAYLVAFKADGKGHWIEQVFAANKTLLPFTSVIELLEELWK